MDTLPSMIVVLIARLDAEEEVRGRDCREGIGSYCLMKLCESL